jgi:hypothetical protein
MTNVVSVECIFQSLGQAFPSIDGTAGYIAENVSAAGLFLHWQEFPDEAVAVAWKWVSSRHQADRIPGFSVEAHERWHHGLCFLLRFFDCRSRTSRRVRSTRRTSLQVSILSVVETRHSQLACDNPSKTQPWSVVFEMLISGQVLQQL